MSPADENEGRDWSYEANRTPPIHAAAERGDIARATKLLDEDPSLISFPFKLMGNDQPLHTAATFGRLQMVKLLVERGAELNAKGDWGRTPLHHAVANGSKRVVSYLLDAGADPYLLDWFPFTPLQLSLCNNPTQHAVAKLLLKKGVVVDVFAAALLDDQEKVRELLSAAPNSIATAPWRYQVFEMLCVRFGEWSIGGPTDFEIFQSHEPLMRLLAEHGTPVAGALKFNISSDPDSIYRVKFFLSLGADVNYKDPRYRDATTPLQEAINNGHTEITKLLIQRGAYE